MVLPLNDFLTFLLGIFLFSELPVVKWREIAFKRFTGKSSLDLLISQLYRINFMVLLAEKI